MFDFGFFPRTESFKTNLAFVSRMTSEDNQEALLVTCDNCKAKCCKYIAVEIDTPETEDDFENIKWYLYHDNVIVYQDWEDSWLVEFRTPCKYLSEENKCQVYDKRPKICKDHDIQNCVMNGNGEPEKVLYK